MSPGINRIFHQFFHYRCRAFNYLTCCYLVDRCRIKDADGYVGPHSLFPFRFSIFRNSANSGKRLQGSHLFRIDTGEFFECRVRCDGP